MGHRQPQQAQKPVRNERCTLGKPQLFLHLSFGVSWSDRHVPRTHNFSYTSENLKSAKNAGNFPRQDPATFHQPRHRSSNHAQHRDDRQRGRPASNPRPRCTGPPLPPKTLGIDPRYETSERGHSAPPSIHDSMRSGAEKGPSSTQYARPARSARTPPCLWKELPASPGKFRLGEDNLPWSAVGIPYEPESDDEDENKSTFANVPTILPISPPSPQTNSHKEDPVRVKELESLSMAMVTVDNGLENEWWNQGPHESVSWGSPAHSEDDMNDMRPVSMAEMRPISAMDATMFASADHYNPNYDEADDLISPLSDIGPNFYNSGFPQRSNTIMSEVSWLRGQ